MCDLIIETMNVVFLSLSKEHTLSPQVMAATQNAPALESALLGFVLETADIGRDGKQNSLARHYAHADTPVQVVGAAWFGQWSTFHVQSVFQYGET